jgi:nitroreductase
VGDENYAAWKIDPTELDRASGDVAKLRHFARYAVLAPSLHNTQPWRFSQRDQALVVRADRTRTLPHSGAEVGEPYVSIGACLEALTLAALGYGYLVSVDVGDREDEFANVSLGERVAPDASLLEAIVTRSSNRSFFETESLPDDVLALATRHQSSGASVRVVTDAVGIAFLAEQTRRGTLAVMGPPGFRHELSDWVRSNVTRKFDGMPGFTQGIPMPPSLVARHLIKNVNISKGQAKKDAARLVHSAAVALVLRHEDTHESAMSAGGLYARVCIQANQQGVATSGVAAATVDPSARQSVMDQFGLDHRPVALIRLGRPTKVARHTPRWPLELVTDRAGERTR